MRSIMFHVCCSENKCNPVCENRTQKVSKNILNSTIHFTLISVFDMTLRSQYQRYQDYIYRMSFKLGKIILCSHKK